MRQGVGRVHNYVCVRACVGQRGIPALLSEQLMDICLENEICRSRRIMYALCHLIGRVDASTAVEQQPDKVKVTANRCFDEARPSVLGGRRQHQKDHG